MDRLRWPPSSCNGDHVVVHAVWAGAVEKTASWLRSVHAQTRNLICISSVYYAATNIQFAMVQFLIQHGTIVNDLHEMFTMPLHVDAQFGNNAMGRVLHAMEGIQTLQVKVQ